MTDDVTRLPIIHLRLTLRLTRSVQLSAYHGAALHGLVTRALDMKPFHRGLAVRCVEWWSYPRRRGSLYRFGMTAIGPGRELLNGARHRFARRGQTAHLGGRGSLDGCFEVEECEEVDAPSIEQRAEALRAESGPLEVRFRTPSYLHRPAHKSRGGLPYLNREDFPAEGLLRRVGERWLETVRGSDGPMESSEEALPPMEHATSDASALINIHFLEDAERFQRGISPPRPLKGTQGLLRLFDVDEEWLPLLVFGSHAQVGSGLGFGQGYYQLTRGGLSAEEWCTPCGSLLDHALSPEVLGAAELRVRDSCDVKHDGWMPAAQLDSGDVERASVEIQSGTYQPAVLSGLLIPKHTGGVRALAVPTAADRVLQRAVHDALDADIDTLFEDCSYAYRKGRSVRQAAQAIRRAERNGFTWVLDADITSFFDNVDWPVLSSRVETLLGDARLVALVEQWFKAPVRFGGEVYTRVRGLPQGSPLSPMLANLYLDELDEHLEAAGFAVVRYADDFVVLCRDPEAARQARDAVVVELDALGLSINEEKTRVVSFEDGFHFLGIQFGGSAAEPQSPPADKPGRVLLRKRDVPRGSWLARVPFDVIKRVSEHMTVGARRRSKARAPAVPVRALAEPTLTGDAASHAEGTPAQSVAAPPVAGEKRPLFIVDLDARVSLRGEKITIRQGDGDPVVVPIRGISHISMLGPTRMTIPLVLRCVDLGVPVFFCRPSGMVRASVAPAPAWPAVARQLAHANDGGFCLRFARSVVLAKLHNAATLVVRFRFAGAERVSADIRRLRDSCEQANTVEEVLGFEGMGARRYFEGWANSLDTSWGFTGRVKHPAIDPVNALLSLTYTVLHNHVSAALVANGLDPRIGFMHRARGAHHALASDLQEEMRHLAESVVWSGIQHGTLRLVDFTVVTGAVPGARMMDDARRRVVRMMEERLFEQFTPDGAPRQRYLDYMDHQARAIRDALHDPAVAYTPLRLHA